MGPMADPTTFDRLVREHLSAAQRFAVRLTGTAGDGEDLVQDALTRAACGWRTFDGRASFRTWLFQVVVNTFRDRLDAKGRGAPKGSRVATEELVDTRASDPAAEAQAGELGERVAALVSGLPPRQREALVLCAYERLTAPEAAAVLGVSPQNVRTSLHFARERLRAQLAPYLDESDPAPAARGRTPASEVRREQS
jgi:RNA polymerase sigma-70 factor, ECF subfamily